jgi:hypothetical protein
MVAFHGARHETGEHRHEPAGDGGEKAEADERCFEERELDGGQEGGHGG